ncbi:hypothetical protein KY330_03670 [Candidatus Woesearchaeota archaeon]|nr:hypothetical protein [Candidatus Woesearchaeota archaeon]
MAFFDFLKRFKEKETVNVKFDDIEQWVDDWESNKFTEIRPRFERIKDKILEKKENLKEAIYVLKQSELKNKEIDGRVKNIMQGNKERYIEKVEKLIEMIKVPDKVEEVPGYCIDFIGMLDKFDKDTIKNYRVTVELFPDEAGAVFSSIKDIFENVQKLKKLMHESRIENLSFLRDKINLTNKRLESRDVLLKNINEQEKTIQVKEKDLINKKEALDSLEKGEGLKNYYILKEKEELFLNKIKELEKKPFHLFSVIEAALRKYERVAIDEKLIKKYLDDSLKALIGDKELKILDVLEGLKSSIIKNEIELKDKKRDKVLKEIQMIDRKFFEDFLSRYKELKDELNKVSDKLNKQTILKDIDDSKKSVKEVEEELEKLKLRLEEIKKEHDSIDFEQLRKELQGSMSKSLDVNIKIE